MQRYKNSITVLFGNMLDHCDTHMYGLLAPFIAPLFFPNDNHFIALGKVHSIALIGIITRPLGALIFARLADLLDPLPTLRYCLMGVAFSTLGICLLPGYERIGYAAPILLIILRAIQSICASGESSIASLYLVSSNPDNMNFFSSIYFLSTVCGALIASMLAQVISLSSNPSLFWRLGFVIGFLTSLIASYIRISNYKIAVKIPNTHFFQSACIEVNKLQILKIAIISGFSYISYSIAFTLTNTLMIGVCGMLPADVNRVNSYLLIFDGLVVIFAFYCLRFLNLRKLMIVCAIGLAISESILTMVITFAGQNQLLLLRTVIIILGVIFAIALDIWLARNAKNYQQNRYFITALGVSIGNELLGRSILTISLLSFNMIGDFTYLVIYIMLLCSSTVYCIYSYPKLDD